LRDEAAVAEEDVCADAMLPPAPTGPTRPESRRDPPDSSVAAPIEPRRGGARSGDAIGVGIGGFGMRAPNPARPPSVWAAYGVRLLLSCSYLFLVRGTLLLSDSLDACLMLRRRGRSLVTADRG
jgi:hypothetical protein